ncbi:hypothetical protein GCM10022221_35880 [Actinocorallia aurea]
MPRPRGWQVAAVFVTIGAGAVFLVAPLVMDDGETVVPSAAGPAGSSRPSGTAASEPSSESPSSEPTSGSPAPESSPPESVAPASQFFPELPAEVCDSVSDETFVRFVPGGAPESHGGPRAGSCGYGGKNAVPYLRLETRLGDAVGDFDPAAATKWSYDQEFASDSEDKTASTLLLEKVPSLGEEAYRRVFVEPGTAKAATARVVLRVQNVIITVSYSRPYEGKPADQVDACLDGAETVAREALKMYT